MTIQKRFFFNPYQAVKNLEAEGQHTGRVHMTQCLFSVMEDTWSFPKKSKTYKIGKREMGKGGGGQLINIQ